MVAMTRISTLNRRIQDLTFIFTIQVSLHADRGGQAVRQTDDTRARFDGVVEGNLVDAGCGRVLKLDGNLRLEVILCWEDITVEYVRIDRLFGRARRGPVERMLSRRRRISFVR